MTDSSKAYKQHITPKYDAQFRDVKGLNWDPWVGKAYHKTGILIVGHSTYALMDEPWGPPWLHYAETHRDVTRILVCGGNWNDQHTPFKVTSEMFLDAAGKKRNERTAVMFWESVAFANFCQCVVLSKEGSCGCFQPIKALRATIEILKPKLVLVWGTELWEKGFHLWKEKFSVLWGKEFYRWKEEFSGYEDREKINGAIPRVLAKPVPVVGIKLPSTPLARKRWVEFLRAEPVSQRPIAGLIEYLRQQPID